MYRSAIRYFHLISANATSRDGQVLLRDLNRVVSGKVLPGNEAIDVPQATNKAAEYLIKAQGNSADKGFGSYLLGKGWGPSYPETSGYIIPSLYDYYLLTGEERAKNAALDAAEWLVEIQRPSGGWQGGRIGEGKPELVFNTGQVIRGLFRAHEETGDSKFLSSLEKACDWLVEKQDPEGYWQKNALMGAFRVYDSYVDTPLLHAWQLTGNKKYLDAAVRNLEWITRHKQRENGWFEDCDNTVRHNDRPILHTIAYTIDGLIDCGMILHNLDYIEAGKKAADALMDHFNSDGILKGRYDQYWEGSEHMICTGGAQMAIIWFRLDGIYPDRGYFHAAERMVRLLSYIQLDGDTPGQGSLPGSYPMWGRYEPFACPNWATKFFLDALFLYQSGSKLKTNQE